MKINSEDLKKLEKLGSKKNGKIIDEDNLSKKVGDYFTDNSRTMYLSPNVIFTILCGIIIFLIGLAAFGYCSRFYLGHGHLLGLIDFVDVDLESNLPTWYSSSQILICSFLLAIIANAKTKCGDRFRWYWWCLCFMFIFMSLDEVGMVHDKLILKNMEILFSERLSNWLAERGTGLFFSLWIIPGWLFVFVFGIVFIRFLFSLPMRSRLHFILSGIVFVGGALGLEMLSDKYSFDHGGPNIIGYRLLAMGEETFEMLGIALFIRSLLDYMITQKISIRISFKYFT